MPTWLIKCLWTVTAFLVVNLTSVSGGIVAASTGDQDYPSAQIARQLSPDTAIPSSAQVLQIAIELPRGFDSMEIGVVANHDLLVYGLVTADITLPNGRSLARLNLELTEAMFGMLSRICLSLSEADRTDGYFLTTSRGDKTAISCLETGTSAWDAAASWGEGPRGGILLRPLIGGGMLER